MDNEPGTWATGPVANAGRFRAASRREARAVMSRPLGRCWIAGLVAARTASRVWLPPTAAMNGAALSARRGTLRVTMARWPAWTWVTAGRRRKRLARIA